MITRDRRERLSETLRQMARDRAFREQVDEVVVVDDASSEDMGDVVACWLPDATLIRLSVRHGIAKARNVGANHASGEVLMFLDDDGVLADAHRLPDLVATLKGDESLGAVALTVIDGHDDEATDEALSSSVTPTPEARDAPSTQARVIPSSRFFGGAVLLKRAAFEAVGGYSEDLFYSHEEDDLSLRLWRAGYGVVHSPDVRFLHERTDRPVRRLRMRKLVYYYRNRLIVHWRHLPWPDVLRETLATISGGLIRTIPSVYALGCLAGSLAGLARIPGVIRRERVPLSPKQYRAFRQWDEGTRLRPRLRSLIRDLRSGARLDWI
ncbi:MAG: glycosyltransferase family 2 protein [Salinibacter sp.]